MARMLKRWESPRKEGRNDKGKGGSARRRQLKKQMQMLRKQLKSKGQINDQQTGQGGSPRESNSALPIFLLVNPSFSRSAAVGGYNLASR
jgi:hypothetical protein